MKDVTVIFAPAVDTAILALIDYVEPDEIPAVLGFLEDLQHRLVKTLATFPEGGSLFQGAVRMISFSGYTFLYEVHADASEVHVLEMNAPGQNWR